MTNRRKLDVACLGALGALALMTWQIFDPRVWPVMVAMSFGQVLGTASLATFGYVVVTDLLAERRAGTGSPGKKREDDSQNRTEVPAAPGDAPDTRGVS